MIFFKLRNKTGVSTANSNQPREVRMNNENTPKGIYRKLFTLDKWPHSYPPEKTLRHLVFNADSNGFNKVVRRIGRRVLIDEQEFFRWVDEQNGMATK